MLKKIMLTGFIIFISFALGLPGVVHGEETVRLKVQELIGELPGPADSGPLQIRFEILSGPGRGDTVDHEVFIWGHPNYDSDFTPGGRFVAAISYDSAGNIRRISGVRRQRDFSLLILFLIVSVILFAIGRLEGLVGLLATILTVILLFTLLFPVAAAARFLMTVGIFICLATITITISLVMRQSGATIPTLLSLLCVFTFILITASLGMGYFQINPMFAQHSRMLFTYLHMTGASAENVLWNLIVLGIVLSCLGAIMDVAVVISSTIDEIVRDQHNIEFKEAFNHGMKIGREILSTMVNTLVFAYMGMLFPILLSLQVFELSWLGFLNYDFIGIEILRVGTGLAGMALTIPITSVFAAWWCRR